MKAQITQSFQLHFCSKFFKFKIMNVVNMNQSRPWQSRIKMLIPWTIGAIWKHQLPRKEIHSQTKHWLQLCPSLPSWACSFQQNYFSIFWQLIKHQLPEWSSHHTEALSEINGVSHSAFWTCHCKANSHLRAAPPQGQPRAGHLKGFKNLWALRKKYSQQKLQGFVFHSKDKLGDRMFYVGTGNHFYGEAEPCQGCCCGSLCPGWWDGAPWVPPCLEFVFYCALHRGLSCQQLSPHTEPFMKNQNSRLGLFIPLGCSSVPWFFKIF